MAVPIICLTNGRRDCITQTISSIRAGLTGWSNLLILDDSGDDTHRAWLVDTFPDAVIGNLGPQPIGYWRAMQMVWAAARGLGTDTVAFWEDDFVLNRPVDLASLAKVLEAHPYLTQIALVRQAWWPNEHAHGGLIGALEAQGQTFTPATDGTSHWLEHRACFTGNPSLIPRSTFERDWPVGDWSESRFGRELFADPAARGAYWGQRDDPPLAIHIGHQRVGSGY